MLIRDAEPDEFSEVGDIRVSAYLADGFLSPDSGYGPHLRELGADGTGHVLVAARADSRLAGTVMLQLWPQGGNVVRGPGEGEIRALAVRPGERGSGLGRALLAAVVALAREQAVRHLLLLTQPEMKAAQHLYAETGFIRLPERDWSPEAGVILLAYGLRLQPA